MNKYFGKGLPIFGVGPLYVAFCLLFTLCGLGAAPKLPFGDFRVLRPLAFFLGGAAILAGGVLWWQTVVVQRISEKIKEGRLVTDGVYGWVRNPIYTAFLLIFTGLLLLAHNLFLLLLPLFFWGLGTVLMKATEEKWLLEKFGSEYLLYCRQVNRFFPRRPAGVMKKESRKRKTRSWEKPCGRGRKGQE